MSEQQITHADRLTSSEQLQQKPPANEWSGIYYIWNAASTKPHIQLSFQASTGKFAFDAPIHFEFVELSEGVTQPQSSAKTREVLSGILQTSPCSTRRASLAFSSSSSVVSNVRLSSKPNSQFVEKPTMTAFSHRSSDHHFRYRLSSPLQRPSRTLQTQLSLKF